MSLPNPSEINSRSNKGADKQSGQIGEITVSCPDEGWIRVEAHYLDHWKTPMAGAPFKLWINNQLFAEDKLKDYDTVGLQRGKAPKTQAEKDAWGKLGTWEKKPCPKGEARSELVIESDEKAIAGIRDGIHSSLDGTYRNLVDSMQEYQQLWDKYGVIGLEIARAKGFSEAAVGWVTEFGEAEYWKELGNSISDAFWRALDAAQAAYDGVEDIIEDAYEKRGQFIDKDWYAQQGDQIVQYYKEAARSLEENANEANEFLKTNTRRIMAIYNAREAILALPERIANGDVNAVESFIDNELRTIDPEWADQIRYDDNWQGTIELLYDGEAVSLIIVYMDLFFEAVPPTFIAHGFGKAGFYIVVELLFILLGALLGGAGAAARIGVLVGRLTKLTASAGSVGKKIKNAKKAIQAFALALRKFADAMEDLEELRRKLLKSRRLHKKKGRTNQSLKTKRENKKRDGRCRYCGKSDHKTPKPARKKGVVVYE